MKKVVELYYPCSENKGTGQLGSYCVFVFAYTRCWFLMTRLNCYKMVAYFVAFYCIVLCQTAPNEKTRENRFSGSPTRSDTNRPGQLQKQARSLKFLI